MAEHHRPQNKITTELPSDMLFIEILPRLPAKSILRFRLSTSNSRKECYEDSPTASGLYYTSYDDDYKLLRVTHDYDAYIYSLKSDSWRKLGTKPYLKRTRYLISESWGPSYVQDEKLYFLKKGETAIDRMSYSVIRFDTKTEKFSKIATPSLGVPRKAWLNFTLLHKDRKLHLFVIYSYGDESKLIYSRYGDQSKFRRVGAMLWRMDGDGDWTKVVTSQMPKSFCFVEPLHLMRNGSWLAHCAYTGFRVHNVDHVRHLNEISYSNIDRMRITSSAKYIDTLVSPNR
ncbi:hypothetical protein L1887_03166 [Cichorium endivia]|nr:hypothetical protein L1887_03166 [Cichorium endivia]